MLDLRFLVPGNLPEIAQKKDEIGIRREILLQRVLNTLLVTFTIGLLAFALFYPQRLFSWVVPIVFMYLGILAITAARQLNYHLRALIVLIIIQALGLLSLTSYGMSGPGLILVFGAIVLANMFFRPSIGALFTVQVMISLGIVAYAIVTHMIALPDYSAEFLFADSGQWIMSIIIFLFLIILVMISIFAIVQGMSSALDEQRWLTVQLKDEQASLEKRVDERAADLKRRLNQFEVASQIAREIAGETNLENLLTNTVNLIRDRFEFYYVGIFLSDEHQEYAMLHAASGEAGRQMLERGHRLKIGEVGLVGYAVSRGEARISLDVADDMVHYKNPMLPETRSEMVLPLRSGNRTIGALDVQSVIENAFSLEDVRILQTIADQLAIAFEKTNLVKELQTSVKELEASHNAATQKAWRAHLRNTRQRLAYRYNQTRLENYAEETEQSREAIRSGQPVLKTVPLGSGQKEQGTVLAVPIKLRNQVLGVVDIRFETSTVSPDLISLIEGTVSRLAVSLENTRLLEEIQYQAERERLVSEISSKVRAASDVDSVLQIAIQEIGRSLGVSEVMVQLRKES